MFSKDFLDCFFFCGENIWNSWARNCENYYSCKHIILWMDGFENRSSPNILFQNYKNQKVYHPFPSVVWFSFSSFEKYKIFKIPLKNWEKRKEAWHCLMVFKPDLPRCGGCQTFRRRAGAGERANSSGDGTSPAATDVGGQWPSARQSSGERRWSGPGRWRDFSTT